MAKGESKRRIGLMGGTFDPIHNGHLFIADEARVRCRLDEVVFMPNRKPAHRQGKTAQSDAETRFQLTKIAIESNPHFRVSRLEIEREGFSYAFDTVRELQIEYSKAGAEVELFFIVGADSIGEVPTWFRGRELLQMCRFIALSRPNFSLAEASKSLNENERSRVDFIETTHLEIASRELRQRVQNGLTIRYLVPDEVEREVRERGLYCHTTEEE